MANTLFGAYKQELIGDAAGPGHGSIDWELATTIKETYIDHADDIPVPGTDQDIADILAAARVHTATVTGRTSVLSGTTLTQDATDTTHTAVAGDVFESIVLWHDTATEATSMLLVFFDTGTGLPATPNGGNIITQYNASGIFTF